jgi:hypothetical protein
MWWKWNSSSVLASVPRESSLTRGINILANERPFLVRSECIVRALAACRQAFELKLHSVVCVLTGWTHISLMLKYTCLPLSLLSFNQLCKFLCPYLANCNNSEQTRVFRSTSWFPHATRSTFNQFCKQSQWRSRFWDNQTSKQNKCWQQEMWDFFSP